MNAWTAQVRSGCRQHQRQAAYSVRKQYVRNPSGEVMLSRSKTETSVRQVSIPQDAADLLIQEHGKHTDTQYMFPSPVTGEMYTHTP